MNSIVAGSSVLQSAVLTALGVLSGLITFFRVSGRAGRLRAHIKDTLELAKIAEDAGLQTTKEELDAAIREQVERMRANDTRTASRTFDKGSLGVSVFLLVVGAPAAWGLFAIEFLPTTILAWVIVAFLVVFVPIGVVMFFTNDRRPSVDVP